MGLIGNGYIFHKIPGRFLGGSTLSGERNNFNKASAERNSFVGGIPPQGGTPNGYSWPYAWVNAVKNGSISSYDRAQGSSSVTAELTAARIMTANLTGVGSVTDAFLSSLITLNAEITASGVVSEATLASVSNMLAALTGSSSVDGSMSATIPIEASLAASGAIGANLTGLARIEAAILPFTELSPQNLGTEILDLQEVEGGLTVRQALRLISAALAGKIAGAEGTSITIRNAVEDSKARITATVDNNGNRTAISYDLE